MNFRIIQILLLITVTYGYKINNNSVNYDYNDFGSDDRRTSEERFNNCTNIYCISDVAYLDMISEDIQPGGLGWTMISLHILVFICGLFGNSLVCIAVYRNHTMRTVTNYFLVNLAVADLMVLIFCLPPTVVWDITETWFFGNSLCKIILYLQTVSVSVSILTLACIAFDRWQAICHPLQLKSTTGRAKRTILIIWISSLLFDIPDLIVLKVVPSHLKIETIYFTQCGPSWNLTSEKIFTGIKLICLYFGPLTYMTFAYYDIIMVLWRSGIPGYTSSGDVTAVTELTTSTQENLESQLLSRRKAAKMLIVVILVFGLCYLPVHLLTLLRQYVDIPSNTYTVSFSLGAHWLCYANSAMNPIIYSFMSAHFREEFLRPFMCTSARRTQYNRCYRRFIVTTEPKDARTQNCKNMNIGMTMDRMPRTSDFNLLSTTSNSSKPSAETII